MKHHHELITSRQGRPNVEQGLPAFGSARGDQGISNDEV